MAMALVFAFLVLVGGFLGMVVTELAGVANPKGGLSLAVAICIGIAMAVTLRLGILRF